MKKVYLIELGGEKEMYEMDALELETIDSALVWIQGAMESDSEYYNIKINCSIYVQKYEQYDTVRDFDAKALVYIDAESIVTEEMFASQIYSVDTIIESNLSIVSKIVAKGEITEVSD